MYNFVLSFQFKFGFVVDRHHFVPLENCHQVTKNCLTFAELSQSVGVKYPRHMISAINKFHILTLSCKLAILILATLASLYYNIKI